MRPSDDKLTVEQLRRLVDDFAKKRGWQALHNPKEVAIGIVLEATELLQLMQWKPASDFDKLVLTKTARDKFALELADILMYCISFANAVHIDIGAAILRKLELNEERFPAGTKDAVVHMTHRKVATRRRPGGR